MKIKKLLYLMIISFILLWAVSSTAEAREKDTVINLRAKKKSSSSVKLTWKKRKNIKKWTIDLYSGFGDYEDYDKTIKTIKKNVSSYTVKNLKKKRVYYFRVTGYKKEKGKYVKELYADVSYATGLDQPKWHNYWWESKYSPSYITLPAYVEDGFPIQGYEVWRRKAGSSKYKKIKTIKKKSKKYEYKELIFRDKSVKAGCKYYYKIRTFGKVNKKKTYSLFSSVISRKAVHEKGIFDVSLQEVKKGESFTLSIKSDKYNGILELNQCLKFGGFILRDNNKQDYDYGTDYYSEFIDELGDMNLSELIVSEWNVKGVWKKAEKSKTIKVKPGQTVLVKILCKDTPEIIEKFGFTVNCEYDNLDSYFGKSFSDGKSWTSYDSESYH